MEIYGFQIGVLDVYYATIIPFIFSLIFFIYRRKRNTRSNGDRVKSDIRSSGKQADVDQHNSKQKSADQFIDIELKIDKLIRLSWPNKDKIDNKNLNFPEQDIQATNVEDYLLKLLRHIRSVCPRLNIPQMTPKVRVGALTFSAGEFVEEDGWITLTIGSEFLLNIAAAKAILCHEICHYVLNANGIREKSVIENERLTDIAMFVFGLGSVFLKGYKAAPINEYRAGHRLGYLTDDEYYYAIGRIDALWKSGNLQKTSVQELETLLKASILDAKARDRLIKNAQQKYPNMTQSEIIQYVLDTYIRDRR
jgi:hypothetical protein